MKVIKCDLRRLLDERGMSIRQLERESEVNFETLRRMYHDETRQFNRDSLTAVCNALGCDVGDVLILSEK